MLKNETISFDGEFCLEVFDFSDVEQHKTLLELENKRPYSTRLISKTVELYRARRNTLGLDTAVKVRPLPPVSGSERAYNLIVLFQRVAVKLQNQGEFQLPLKIKKFLRGDNIEFSSEELERLRLVIENEIGLSKSDFVFG